MKLTDIESVYLNSANTDSFMIRVKPIHLNSYDLAQNDYQQFSLAIQVSKIYSVLSN